MGERMPIGRPAGKDNGNSEKILAVARLQFASRGFHATTMRGIAAEAGFDVALVAHYFGSKDALFAATIELPADVARLLADVLARPIADQGRALTQGYLSLWEEKATGEQMRALARVAIGDEAGAHVRELFTDLLDEPALAAALKGRRTKLMLALSLSNGVQKGPTPYRRRRGIPFSDMMPVS